MTDIVVARRRLLENMDILVRRPSDLDGDKLNEIFADLSDVLSGAFGEKVVVAVAFPNDKK